MIAASEKARTLRKLSAVSVLASCVISSAIAQSAQAPRPGDDVTVANFARAESDRYFADTVELGGFGKFYHYRAPPTVDNQTVVRMNRDTLYSGAVFDLDAAPVKIILPDSGKRFMSIQVISEDHYTPLVGYAPSTVTLTKDNVGTRYVLVAIRTLIDATDPADVKVANALQDKIEVKQAHLGKFEVPNWDSAGRDEIRKHLAALQSVAGITTERRMGRKGEVDPVFHLLATATSWGLNPPEDAIYKTVFPKANDGKTVHTLTVKDVPVDGFWSITVYDADGHLFENPQKAYAVNNFTAKANEDGSYTVQFGGDPSKAKNYLAITPGWNYSMRLYRPRKEVINGTWRFPEPRPVE